MIKGYVCRSKNSDRIMISIGSMQPEKHPDGHRKNWFFYIPGWFHTMSVRTFKKTFGFSVKPGACKQISISISED